MIKKICSLVLILMLFCSYAISQDNDQVAKGVVFEDKNKNGKRDEGEPGIPGVMVSNQREVFLTDSEGKYQIPVSNDSIIFVTKPSGYAVPLNKLNVPKFYYIHKPLGSPEGFRYPAVEPTGDLPESIDFPLTKQTEPDQFKIIALADTQPVDGQELGYVRDDVVTELIGTDAAFTIVLGDLLFDNLLLFPGYNQIMALIGKPVYNVIGNHDMNFLSEDDENADETYHRYYGPNYYSWDYGKVHFMTLDNIIWLGRERNRYGDGLGEKQLEWIKNDIARVPGEKLIVLNMHAPMQYFRGERRLMGDCKELFKILKDRKKVLALSGHTHVTYHNFFTEENGWDGEGSFHHINCVTACGSWWSGPKDYRGIPVADQRDGAPNGYTIIDFDGADYVTTYKAAGFSPDFQMRIYPPDRSKTSGDQRNQILVNIFHGSDQSEVEYSIDGGPFKPMRQEVMDDPLATAFYSGATDSGKSWVNPVSCLHIWIAEFDEKPSRGLHYVTVREKDQYGREHKTSAPFYY